MTGATNIKFLQDGGVPLTNDLMAEIMNSIQIFNVLGEIGGNLTILTGCVVTGNTVSSGVVYINGDILPFEGGYISDSVIVEETTTDKIFEDLQPKSLIYKKVAKFGIGNPQYAWSDFVNVDDLRTIMQKLNSKASQSSVDELANLINAMSGSITTLGNSLTAHVTNQQNPHAVSMQQIGIIKRGSIYLGDINGKSIGWTSNGDGYSIVLISKNQAVASNGGDDQYRVTFTENLPTTNYAVVVTFTGADWNNDNDLTYAIISKRLNGFDIAIREVSPNTQTTGMDYIIIKMD